MTKEEHAALKQQFLEEYRELSERAEEIQKELSASFKAMSGS